jgi:hypothetical protein
MWARTYNFYQDEAFGVKTEEGQKMVAFKPTVVRDDLNFAIKIHIPTNAVSRRPELLSLYPRDSPISLVCFFTIGHRGKVVGLMSV